jgi:hypothetical protein
MKNLFIVLVLALLITASCKDVCPNPSNSFDIEDIMGVWVSLDSVLIRHSADSFFFGRDYLDISVDSFILNDRGKYPKSAGVAWYTYKLSDCDSISLSYVGPRGVDILDNNMSVKMHLNEDTLRILYLDKVYPYSHSNDYLRL